MFKDCVIKVNGVAPPITIKPNEKVRIDVYFTVIEDVYEVIATPHLITPSGKTLSGKAVGLPQRLYRNVSANSRLQATWEFKAEEKGTYHFYVTLSYWDTTKMPMYAYWYSDIIPIVTISEVVEKKPLEEMVEAIIPLAVAGIVAYAITKSAIEKVV